MTDDAAHVRAARAADASAIARIFNQGIEDRVATFQTNPQEPSRFEEAIASGDLVLVAERERGVVGAAWIGPYSDENRYYDGVGEATLYVEREARRTGVGSGLIARLACEAQARGYHKLLGKLFSGNEASLALLEGAGWRVVGSHLRHGELDGEWIDVIVAERLLGERR